LGACGGGRDRWKRPEFGKIAAEKCDEIILTDEDPFDENPARIIEEIKSGIGKQFPKAMIKTILDRRAAIKQAISSARDGDAVIITGKGSEPYIRVAHGKRISWSDRRVAEEVLKEENKFHEA
jgi:UDP-N-acetylmuramoyl-L-alanyl-D-glutamate--2,6-diaminopimelate ligase